MFLSTRQNYFRRWSYSEKKKSDNNSDAVLLKFKTGLQPLTVTGRIMIRVSELEKGGSKLTVKLVDIEAMSDKSVDADWRYMYANSSGLIEEEIIKFIKIGAN